MTFRESRKYIRTFSAALILATNCLIIHSNVYAAIPQQERDALIDLYNATGGENWSNKSGWLGLAGTECSWFGVTCDESQTTTLRLLLSFNQLRGSIPASLENLANLQSLKLGSNALSGNIPISLGNLKNLQDLILGSNKLSGDIPASLGNLSSLQTLSLGSNNLIGAIPSTLGNISTLQSLDLGFNQLSGELPSSLGRLINLDWFYTVNNQLSGPIPVSLGNLGKLRNLRLSKNRLSGSIPSSFGSLSSLQSLDLYDNRLSGNIPPELGNLSNLIGLDLSNNQLGGSIPPGLGNLSKLLVIAFSDNQLSGSIPASLGGLTNLQSLLLSDNLLSDTIPSTFGSLTNLMTLRLDHNQLSGFIPPSLGNLANLQAFYLDHNRLSGGIPASLGGLANLRSLQLNVNQLSDTIPPALGSLASLEYLGLGNNRLSGSIPASLGNLTNLWALDIGSNNLIGNVPSSLSNLSGIYFGALDISFNALYATEAKLIDFLNLRMSGWQLTQTVPPANLSATAQSSSSILVSWTPIAYTADNGRYDVFLGTAAGGPYTLAGSTLSKSASSLLVTGLNAGTTYYLVTRTVTDPGSNNQNTVVSEYSLEVMASTGLPGSSTSITITTSPGGRTFSVDGISYTSPQTFSWTIGSSHTISTASPQGLGSARYVFAGWSDRGANAHAIIVPASPTTYTANFTTQYQLTTTETPSGAGTISTNPSSQDGFYDSGTTILVTAVSNSNYSFSAWSGDLTGSPNPQSLTMSMPKIVTANFLLNSCSSLVLNPGGAASCKTIGTSTSIRVGYARLEVNSGTSPFGTAVFSLKQNGITVTEAGVPATPPTTQARIFIDYRSKANAIPGRTSAGRIDVNTGVAIANAGAANAAADFTLRDSQGVLIASGRATIPGGKHFAKFIDQIRDIAPDFILPSDFQTSTQFGSLEISSDQPLSILALRGTINQEDEFHMTTTPVADMNLPFRYDSVYFPQLVDGGGYTTSLILLNTTTSTERGVLQILDNNGAPFVVNQAGGTSSSFFRYLIPPSGAFYFQTDGASTITKSGWVQLNPEPFSATPVSSGILAYNPGSILVSESGVPSTSSTIHARVYVDLSSNHNMGLAIANLGGVSNNITIRAYQKDGTTAAGTSLGPLQLSVGGHDAKFADQFISDLPTAFAGVLDVSSPIPFAALTLRSLVNERGDFLMSTFPVVDFTQAAPAQIIFPEIADGGGYVTEFILLSAGQFSNTTLECYDENGEATDFSQ